MKLSRSNDDRAPAAISIERLDPPLLEALLRLFEVLDDPQLRPYVAPLIQQEIIFRLLLGRHGSHLRKLVAAETPSQQIASVVAWIKQNFTEAIRMDELAAKANMSPSTFRQHFPRHHWNESTAIPEAAALAGSAAVDAEPEHGCWPGGYRGRLRKRLAV